MLNFQPKPNVNSVPVATKPLGKAVPTAVPVQATKEKSKIVITTLSGKPGIILGGNQSQGQGQNQYPVAAPLYAPQVVGPYSNTKSEKTTLSPKAGGKNQFATTQANDVTHDQILPGSAYSNMPVVVSTQGPAGSQCCGIFFSVLLLLGTLGYLAVTVFSLLDKRDKEAYFDEDTTERTLMEAMMVKALNPTWTMRTDDWGYFYRSFDAWKNDQQGPWKDYEVLIPIVCTAGVTGIMWIIASILEIVKFCGNKWDLACCGFTTCLLCLLMNMGGNGYVFYRFYKFRDDTKSFWDYYDCSSFKYDYFRSQLCYGIATISVLFIALVQLIVSLVFLCSKPSRSFSPQM